jgi:hypothetical protein
VDFSQPVNELYQTADHPALSPVFAILNGGSKRRRILADLASPRGKSTENTRHKSSPDGVWRQGRGLVWLISPTAYGFDDFSKLTWHLGHVLLNSFSGFKACSFDVTWDFGRWLFIVGQ